MAERVTSLSLGARGSPGSHANHDLSPLHRTLIFSPHLLIVYTYFWLRWVFSPLHGLSLAAASRGQLFAAVRGLLIVVASLADHRLQAHGLRWLWYVGLVVLRHVESSQTREQTHIPCTGRWILIHCTTREVPGWNL